MEQNDNMQPQFEEVLSFLLHQNGMTQYASPTLLKQYSSLYNAVLQHNAVMNLTTIVTPYDFALKHVVDCLTLCEYIPLCTSVLDLGCGGGFPTLPLAIARPDIKITAMDSTAKKVDAVRLMAQELNLTNIQTVVGRAEELAQGPMRESFQIVVSRAVARANILMELALPFLHKGGKMIAMKGPEGTEELQEAQKAITLLGGKMVNEFSIKLLFETKTEIVTANRTLLIIAKEQLSPKEYPRNWGQIKKKPL